MGEIFYIPLVVNFQVRRPALCNTLCNDPDDLLAYLRRKLVVCLSEWL